jgi:hypothetical protein
MRDPEGMRDLVAKAVSSLGLGELATAGRLFRSWEEIVGPEVAARSQPLSLRDGVLRIQTDSPAWAAEVRYLAPELLRRTNAALGRELARELKVSLRPSGRDTPSGRDGEGHKGVSGARGWRPAPPTGGAREGGPRRPSPAQPPVPPADPGARPGADGRAERGAAKPSPDLPIRDGRLADAVSRVLDAARANPRDNKGRRRPQ